MSESTKYVPMVAPTGKPSTFLCDVVVPEKYDYRVTTGLAPVDKLLGGEKEPGALIDTSILISGVPGSGKTTLTALLADSLVELGGETVLYNSTEMSKPMFARMARRMDLKGRFILSDEHDADQLVATAVAAKATVIIQDSLQTLSAGGRHGKAALEGACRRLNRAAKEYDIVVIFIAHVTKAGTIAGPESLIHEVDAHLHLAFDKKEGRRYMQMEKNRGGPAQIPYEYRLVPGGIEMMDAVAMPSDDGTEKAAGGGGKLAMKQAEVKDFVKKKLLEGEEISGYCFERFHVPVSGGYWRGMVRQAAVDLADAGHAVLEKKVAGRTCVYLEKPSGKAVRHLGLVE